jgi:hypothetical protein
MASKLHNVCLSLGNSITSISISANALRRMKFDRLKFTPTVFRASRIPLYLMMMMSKCTLFQMASYSHT